MTNRKPKKRLYLGDLFLGACLTLIILIVIYQLIAYKSFQSGILTAYDTNMNPKMTVQGDFEYKGNNTWYDQKGHKWYTFDNAVFEEIQ